MKGAQLSSFLFLTQLFHLTEIINPHIFEVFKPPSFSASAILRLITIQKFNSFSLTTNLLANSNLDFKLLIM